MTFLHKLAQRLARLWTASVIAVVAVTSCKLPPARVTAPPGDVAKLDLAPSSLTLFTDRTSDFVVVALTASDDTVDAAVNWTTNGGSIAPTNIVGGRQYARYRAPLQPGRYKVFARAGSSGVSDSSVVDVNVEPVASVSVNPASASVTTGQTVQLTATPRDASGNPLTGRVVTWATNDGAVATVSGSGLVTAQGGGTATITATSEGQSGTAAITVTQPTFPVASVSVTPASLSLTVGQTGQLTATPRDAGGSPLTGRVVTWTTNSAAVATVNGNGLVTAQGAGTATITATSEGKSATAAITVTLVPVASVSVSPATLSLTVGQMGQLTATPRDASGNPLTGRVVTWTTNSASVATVSSSGLVTGQGAGTATITATSEGQSGTAAITVTQPTVPVASVSVSPPNLSLTVGQTGQLTATPRDASGNPLTGRVVTWTTNSAAVATVNSTGLVTAQGAGTATITATSEGRSGTVAIIVTLVPVAAVSVSPATLSLTVGQTGQLTATPRDAAGNPLTGRVVTWASTPTTVATVSASGLVTGAGAGTATVTATSEGQNGSATVTVTAVPVASVSVTPASLNLAVGQTGQLTATPRDAAGNPLTGRVVTWAIDNAAVATVNGSGAVTGTGAGTATATATSEGRSGSATVTVTAASLLSGLDFRGNVNWPAASPSMMFVWNATVSGTAPFPAYPATYIWRVYPRAQNGFWTFLFHAKYQPPVFDQEYKNEYYGMHPFKDPPITPKTMWEISSYGADTYVDTVVYDRWYTQVAVVNESGGVEFHTYYWNWPNTTTDLVTADNPSKPPPANPAISVGDAPWNPGYEIPNAIIRGFQYYDVKLTLSEIAQEIAAPGSVRRPWYLNLNPTPSDISDKSGNGHHPSWVGPGRPTLWTGTGP
jgi:uncharacterized protein YjdB